MGKSVEPQVLAFILQLGVHAVRSLKSASAGIRPLYFLNPNAKTLVTFCGRTARVFSEPVESPSEMFSRNDAQRNVVLFRLSFATQCCTFSIFSKARFFSFSGSRESLPYFSENPNKSAFIEFYFHSPPPPSDCIILWRSTI